MTEDQIKYMVSRFLTWRLPENFNPDGGISFQRDYNQNTPWPAKHEPVGTNLFDGQQAEAMVRHMIDGVETDYDRGRRDMLNALLALNPRAAQRLHIVSGGTEESFSNHEGRIPFDVVFWVTEVAEQLGIEPKDDLP